MISSLFIRPPWDSDGIIFSGHDAPPGRVVPVDSAKTGLASAHPEAGGHVENRALLIPRLKSDLETGANVASLFAIYSNRKSTVSRVRVFFFAVIDFFSRRRNADPFRPRKRDAQRSVRKFRGGSRGAIRSPVEQSREVPPGGGACRRRPEGSAAWPRRGCAG